MASDITVQSVLGKISEGHLECSICYNRFREPKVLDCLHTFCLKCLENFRESLDLCSTMLPCPLCRCETVLPENGVMGLPSNFTLRALVEEVTMQEQLLEGQGSETKCQACDEKNRAIAICMDCVHFLCQECRRAHERLAVMNSHKIYTMAQLRSGEIVYKSKLREEVPRCEVHPYQNLSIYCNTCEKLVCTTCSILAHGNLKHSLAGLPEAVDKCKRDVAEVVAGAEKNKRELISAVDTTDKSRRALDAMFSDTIEKISRKAEAEIAKIRKEIDRIRGEEQKLREEGTKIYQERVKTYEKAQDTNSRQVDRTEHKLDEANRLMAQASCYQILELKNKLLLNLRESTQVQPATVPESLSFMNFTAGDEKSLGKLVLGGEEMQEPKADEGKESTRPWRFGIKETWKLTEIKSSGPGQKRLRGVYDVAIFSNNEIVMVDFWYRQLISFFPKSESKDKSPAISQRLKIKGITCPRRVSVNKEDQLIVLDGPAVKTFNREYRLLSQFTVGGGTKCTPTCLAVDEDNMIAVGYESKGEISLHNPDGTLVKMLQAPLVGGYLTASKHHLIYTSYKRQKLLSLSYNGATVFSVGVTSNSHDNWGPTGVCPGINDGSLYVAMHGRPSSEVHRLTSDGEHLGCVIKECSFPHSIKFTPAGELVVATADSVRIYHRVQ